MNDRARSKSGEDEIMRYFLGVGLGILGGLLLNVEIGAAAIILTGPSGHSTSSWLMTLGVVVWTLMLAAGCATVLLFRVKSTLSVFKRGCALGLLLWIALLPLASGVVPRLAGEGDADVAAAAQSSVSTAAAVMIVVCAGGLAAAMLVDRGRRGTLGVAPLPRRSEAH